MPTNKKQTPKRTCLTRKIKRLFRPAKGKQPHKLYAEEYFKQYWFNRPDCNGIKVVGRIEGISKKAAAHLIFEYGFRCYMGIKVGQHLDAMNTPEGQREQAIKTRFILEMRRLARERGWDISKIF